MPNLLILRFNDHDSDELVRPVDDDQNLEPMTKTGAAMPAVVEAAVGFGRQFVSANGDGLAAVDAAGRDTLVTRDATIQTIMWWDIEAAVAYGSPQTIYARGKGTGAGEYAGAILELRVVNAALRIGEIRWAWHTVAGVLKTQVGGHFQVPADGFLMLTATRRWVSSSRVVLRHYLGDALLSEVESVDGDIGGGTTGTTQIGTRYTGAAYERRLDGVIDELRVLDEEITWEEVKGTWRRITVEQPRGYQLVREMHDPGFPISQDPSSRAQKETRLWGHALGYAAAQAENVRENILPDRAYGAVLTRWETMTKQPAIAGDDIDTRRRRVVGRIRQKRGVSILGVGDAVGDLLDTDPANLEILAFDQTVVETFETLNTARWRYTPPAQWSIAGGAALRVQSIATVDSWFDWYRARQSVGGAGLGAAVLLTITPTTVPNGAEVGFEFFDRIRNNSFAFGLRNVAGVYSLATTITTFGVAAASVQHAVVALVPVWILIAHREDLDDAEVDASSFDVSWSTVGPTGPFTSVAGIATAWRGFHWGALYARGTTGIDVQFPDATVRSPHWTRPFRFYVYRDPALPGAPDFLGANAVLRGLKQSHTTGVAVATLVATYDSDTGYDREPMGGI